MKALSVVEMPGTAIACGKKTLEVRHWRPEKLPLLDLVIVQNKRRLTTSDPVDPEGKVVAIVDVKNIRDWRENDLEASCSSTWESGWLAWELENVRRVIDGPEVPAMRRIYDVDLYIDDLLTE